MAYYNIEELKSLNLKYCGSNVKISKDARIYYPENLSIGDNSRIDDFVVISGDVEIGKHVHIAPHAFINGNGGGVIFEDFSTLAIYSSVMSISDDYAGRGLNNPTIDKKYRKNNEGRVTIGKHCIIGAYSLVMPGVDLAMGCSVGSHSFLSDKKTTAWKIYVGKPAQIYKDRMKDKILQYEKELISSK